MDLLADLRYNFNTALEEDMQAIFDLTIKVEKVGEGLNRIDHTLSTLHRVLNLVPIIKYAKPIIVSIRKVVMLTFKHAGTKHAVNMLFK